MLLPRSARDTVGWDTPASSAISKEVGFEPTFVPYLPYVSGLSPVAQLQRRRFEYVCAKLGMNAQAQHVDRDSRLAHWNAGNNPASDVRGVNGRVLMIRNRHHNYARLVRSVSAMSLAAAVESFVREVVIPYEGDPRCGPHGPSDELVRELKEKALAAGLLTPHVGEGGHLSHRDTSLIFEG
ncbi:MAG: hypothetical protein HC774_07620 [Sphingomonadales bacterium]|nr:hypothetical protein [Sphingomonadales bacterium]